VSRKDGAARGRPGPARPVRARWTARAVALDVIRRVTDEGAYSNLAIARTLERARLPELDAAFATELAYGTLRRLVPIDRLLAGLVDRPLETAPKDARAALRLGAYQLRYLRVPAHAAVAETVALVPARRRGFVNAVLRRLAAAGAEMEPEPDDPAEAIAQRTGLAPWAAGELVRLLGDEADEAAAALAERGPTTLRVNPCRASVKDVEEQLGSAGVAFERGALDEGSLLLRAGSPSALPGFAEGHFAVQDQASAFVVRVLAPVRGERIADVCAGPGGKAGHLACLVGEKGRVVAADVSTARVGLVRETLERLGVRAALVVQDARRPALREGFDAVLVDAPCSGIGSARRRPELLWRARRDELSGLARLQVGIATAAAGLLRPGGRLVYSVCTFPRAETDAVCDALLRRRPDLEPLALAGPEGPAERIRLWPHRHGSDAMFIAGFRRRATATG
jgi:16S rRNA (cytosine967-C5)-methyltransferase